MKKTIMCKKEWALTDVVYFEEGKNYVGIYKEHAIREGVHTFSVKADNGPTVHFHSGSDYFDIPFESTEGKGV